MSAGWNRHIQKSKERFQRARSPGPRSQAALCLQALESLGCRYLCSKRFFPEASCEQDCRQAETAAAPRSNSWVHRKAFHARKPSQPPAGL